MTDIKRFTSPPPSDGDPLPFVLEGWQETIGDDGEARRYSAEHTFHVRPSLTGSQLLQLEMMSSGTVKIGKNARGGDAVMDFYVAALVPEDVDRFRELLDEPTFYVHASTLQAIIVWLYEVYAARPTQRSSS